jgi:hypothetical protein
MALTGTVRTFGLRDVKVTNIGGTVQADLPAAMTLSFKEEMNSGEMHGDDAVQATVAFTDKLSWELEAGGISLECLAIMTGRTVTLSGTGSSEINTVIARAGDAMPYFKIYGKSLGDGTDDIHVKIVKAKIMGGIEGEFKDGEFYVQKCEGIAIDDGTALYTIVQNETATTLPTS